jgi:hypothetical protein
MHGDDAHRGGGGVVDKRTHNNDTQIPTRGGASMTSGGQEASTRGGE